MMRCCVQAAAERPAELSSSTYKNDMDIHTYIHTHTLHRHNILQCTVEPESERQSLRIIVLRSCSNVANRQFNNGLRSGLYYRQWWRQGSPRDGVIVPRQGGWGNARSTLPCKLPPPTSSHYIYCEVETQSINKLHAHKQELTEGCCTHEALHRQTRNLC